MILPVIFILLFSTLLRSGGCLNQEKRDDEDDLASQFQTASNLSSGATFETDCFANDCLGNVNLQYCEGAFKQNAKSYSELLGIIPVCFSKPVCGVHLNRQTIGRVSLPITVAGYDGRCTLQGPQVTVQGGSDVNNEVTLGNLSSDEIPQYDNDVNVKLNWSGLSIHCNSNQRVSSGLVNLLSLLACNFETFFGTCTSSQTFVAPLRIEQNVELLLRLSNNWNSLNARAINVNATLIKVTTLVSDTNSIPTNYQNAVRTSVEQLMSSKDFGDVFTSVYRDVYSKTLKTYFIINCLNFVN